MKLMRITVYNDIIIVVALFPGPFPAFQCWMLKDGRVWYAKSYNGERRCEKVQITSQVKGHRACGPYCCHRSKWWSFIGSYCICLKLCLPYGMLWLIIVTYLTWDYIPGPSVQHWKALNGPGDESIHVYVVPYFHVIRRILLISAYLLLSAYCFVQFRV